MYATPPEAEAAFYDAFNRGDAEGMRAVWVDEDSIVCIHPGADILEGRDAVHASWGEILKSPPLIRHELRTRSQGPLLAVHTGHEWVPTGAGRTAVLAVTNVFQVTPGGWLMLLHHAAQLDILEARPGTDPVH